jgi:flagellar biosynthetic protein FlhB
MADGEQPDNSQKTEDASPKKLEEARKKGQVAISRELNNWVMLLTATIITGAAGTAILSGMYPVLIFYLERAHDIPDMPGGLNLALGEGTVKIFGVLAAPLIILMIAAFLSSFLQVGPIFSTEIIKPDISKISPIKGFHRLFSTRSLIEFVKGIFKITIVGTVGYFAMEPYFAGLDHMIGLPMETLSDEIMTMIMRMMTGILAVLIIIAAIDIVYQRYDHAQKMRMTKQETKDEYKQTEGDPHVKARLRQLRSERARRRMMQAVPRADVVITNPTHFAIALEYKPALMEAPVCIAKGIDNVALRIREVAKENDIIIYENPPLARALYDTVELDETIPAEQYKAVAEVISFVFKAKGKKV